MAIQARSQRYTHHMSESSDLDQHRLYKVEGDTAQQAQRVLMRHSIVPFLRVTTLIYAEYAALTAFYVIFSGYTSPLPLSLYSFVGGIISLALTAYVFCAIRPRSNLPYFIYPLFL